MIHKPIYINDLELSFPHKICFEDFSCQIPCGSRIAIIGRNGSGKSSLLRKLVEHFADSQNDYNLIVGYVPQLIDDNQSASGAEQLNKAITNALKLKPNILLLDEPTNHLDQKNRKNLLRMIHNFRRTLIIVSHDTALLASSVNVIWHIDEGRVNIFNGSYNDYINETSLKRTSIQNELKHLNKQKKDMHNKLMQEQERAAKSKEKGRKNIDKRKWPTIVSKAKALNAEETSGRKKTAIYEQKSQLIETLQNIRLSEVIKPRFSISSANIGERSVSQIIDGSIGYKHNNALISKINLTLHKEDKLAIMGDNASGKSSLAKAILHDPMIYKTGQWHVLNQTDIGYLDQHYSTLSQNKSVFETIEELVPHWAYIDIRSFLNDFLFRKNEEVNAKVSTLSGGEKARLCLAQIAARTPKLLILDEISNNLDIETKEHIIQILSSYPGAMIIISHDGEFLDRVGITNFIHIENGNIITN